MENICRVCLTRSDNLVNIFKKGHKDKTSIADMIAMCTGSEATEDSLPRTICPHCLKDLTDANDIIICIGRSHQFFCQVKDEGVENALCDLIVEEEWNISKSANEIEDRKESLAKNLLPNTLIEKNERKSLEKKSERPFKCPQCPKSFMKSTDRLRHTRIHENIRPHICSECSRSFSKRIHLQDHMRRHTGERPFECPHCSKAFGVKSNLQRHQRTHRP